VVQGATSAGVLHQHQLQCGLVERVVGIAGAALGGFGVAQSGVEGNRFVDGIDI
jgi:hypothetical protein